MIDILFLAGNHHHDRKDSPWSFFPIGSNGKEETDFDPALAA